MRNQWCILPPDVIVWLGQISRQERKITFVDKEINIRDFSGLTKFLKKVAYIRYIRIRLIGRVFIPKQAIVTEPTLDEFVNVAFIVRAIVQRADLLEDIKINLDLVRPLVDKIRIGHGDKLIDFIILDADIDAFFEFVENISKCVENINSL